MIHAFAAQHNIKGYSGKLTREKAEDFIAILQDHVSDSKEACNKIEVRSQENCGFDEN